MNQGEAYLLGMIIGNGEIQKGDSLTNVTIDIPFKNLYTDDLKDVAIYLKASLIDIKTIVEPIICCSLTVVEFSHSIKLSFRKANSDPIIKDIEKYIGGGFHHSTMRMNSDLFSLTTDERKSFLRGIADVTAYIRKSNIAFGAEHEHRVYIEVPGNFGLVVDIANMLKTIDIPVQTLDFGHPNFRDSNLKKYNEGKKGYWKKEHQLKVYANEFLPVGFNVKHKQEALEKYAAELLSAISSTKTHKYYWEKSARDKVKPHHPGENDPYLPASIRGKHFDSWQDLAKVLGYGK